MRFYTTQNDTVGVGGEKTMPLMLVPFASRVRLDIRDGVCRGWVLFDNEAQIKVFDTAE